ncbi:MAG TPA: paraquat-inducible protein A [Methylophilaceae bacterium]|nr:paraquat-inducible protein A [Methylophilaceae bacterium]
MSRLPITAASLGLLSCHDCDLLSKPTDGQVAGVCPRCGAHMHLRKPNSLTRTWALLITAAILYIPANLLPVMQAGSMFGSQKDTIFSGVVYLWNSGSAPIALLIFFASITVPLAKLIALTYLLISVHRHSQKRPLQRTQIYRLAEFVGRWSMIDVYVVALLVTLVQFGGFATIEPGPGAIAFGGVVVLTMIAAMSFDPRLIWDPIKEKHD